MKKKNIIILIIAVLLVLAMAITAVVLGKQSRSNAPQDTDKVTDAPQDTDKVTDAPQDTTSTESDGTDAPQDTDVPQDTEPATDTPDDPQGTEPATEPETEPETDPEETDAQQGDETAVPDTDPQETDLAEPETDAPKETEPETDVPETDAPETTAPETDAPQACVHNYTSKITTPATCTTNGVKTLTCTKCGSTKTESIPATGHTASAGWKSDGTNHWHTCSTCGAKMDAAKHTAGAAASDGSVKCSVCGYLMKEGTPTDECTHDWKATGTDFGTCLDPWYVIHKSCTKCGAVKDERNHMEGMMLDSSADYHDTYVTSTDEANHHQTLQCRNCGRTFGKYYEPPVVEDECEHEWVLEKGQRILCNVTTAWYQCTKCGKFEKRSTGMTGEHHYEFTEHVHETAIEGYGHRVKDYDLYTCSVCGGTTSKNSHSDADYSAHTFTSWEVISTASATTDYIRERHCTVCGYREMEEKDNDGNVVRVVTPFTHSGDDALGKVIDCQYSSNLYTKPWNVTVGATDYRKNVSANMEVVMRRSNDSVLYIWHDASGKEYSARLYADDGDQYHILGITLIINEDGTYYGQFRHGFFSIGSYYGPIGEKILNPGCSIPPTPHYDFYIRYTH